MHKNEPPRLRDVIFAFLQEQCISSEEGVAFDAICSHVDPEAADRVWAALNRLIFGGDVCTTTDEVHFQCF